MSEKSENSIIEVEKILPQIIKLPLVRVDREKFLRKEFKVHYPKEMVETAIIYSPAYAGIPLSAINKFANDAIAYETTKVASLSFAAGIPGGAAMAATIPADTAQYFTFSLRILQKLVYLYSFPDFDLNEDNINEETLGQLIVFIGIMNGAKAATPIFQTLAKGFAEHLAKEIPKKALMKGAWYPLLKTICKNVGINMTKPLLAKSVTKIVPVLGGVASGAITVGSFVPCAKRLQKKLKALPICDPDSEIYKSSRSSLELLDRECDT